MSLPRFAASFASPDEFLGAYEKEVSAGGLLVRGANADKGVMAGGDCTLEVRVAAHAPVELPARIAAVVPGVGVAVMFTTPPQALGTLAQKLKGGSAAAAHGAPAAGHGAAAAHGAKEVDHRPLVERLHDMTVQQKMQLGLSGSRDERTMLLRDTNKAIHLYVLRNPRIGLDEVQTAARFPQLSMEAIKYITEHAEWAMNPSICTGLVRNPSTPIPLALRLMDRVPVSELRVIAKGGARQPIVQAARKKLNE
jgi:hypothetical protein